MVEKENSKLIFEALYNNFIKSWHFLHMNVKIIVETRITAWVYFYVCLHAFTDYPIINENLKHPGLVCLRMLIWVIGIMVWISNNIYVLITLQYSQFIGMLVETSLK